MIISYQLSGRSSELDYHYQLNKLETVSIPVQLRNCAMSKHHIWVISGLVYFATLT